VHKILSIADMMFNRSYYTINSYKSENVHLRCKASEVNPGTNEGVLEL